MSADQVVNLSAAVSYIMSSQLNLALKKGGVGTPSCNGEYDQFGTASEYTATGLMFHTVNIL